tara:strand:+ start:200 stop:886 length:687 start_codon:yes stop_codon:yes gene_type:complete
MVLGRHALVTGATGGLGRCIATKLASEGCTLSLLGRSDTLNDIANDIGDAVENVFKVDFCDPNSLGDFLKVDQEVDILVNCAGTFPVKSLSESSIEDYEKCFDINVKAPFLLSKKFAEGMKERNWGRIVNIGSSSSYAGSPNSGLYCASKHALLGLSRSQYLELNYYNVRTFCLSPGSIQTNMGKKVPSQDYSTFMKPTEIADYLINMIKFDNEMISEEVRLNRIIIR